MADTLANSPDAPAADPAAALTALRAELDRLDDMLHDTLMRRAEVVGRVAGLGAKGRTPLRPGREAAIIRRLLARHAGAFPQAYLLRLWRELICGNTAIQRPILIAVCDTDPHQPFAAAAHEHFGPLTPLHVHRSAAQALGEVSAGTATAAVLPCPAEEEAPRDAWWTALLHKDEPRIHVVARLPFWAPRPDGAPKVQALVASAAAPDPSGADRSLLGLELPLDASRARLGAALAAAGLAAGPAVILRRDPGAASAYALADVDGFVPDGDPRLAALAAPGGAVLRPPVVLGAYSKPLQDPPR